MWLSFGNVGQGIVSDPAPHELPDGVWSGGRNVRARDGYLERIGGYTSPYGATSVTPYFLMPLMSGTTRYWLYGGTQKLYSVDKNSTHTNITRQTAGVDVNYSATADTRWVGTELSGVAVLTNGIDVPQYWGGTGKAAALSNWPASTYCRAIRSHRQHLIALNITKGSTNYAHMVKWSHPADPGTLPVSWDETDPTRDAGEFDLASDPTPIVDGASFGQTFYVFKEGSVWAMDYIGGSYIWSQRLVSGTAGVLTTNCLAETPMGLVALGQDDLYLMSGGEPQSVLSGRMRRWLYNQFDADNYVRNFVAANPRYNEVMVGFVASGGTTCDLALVWNWKENTTSIRALPQVTHAAAGVVDSNAANSWDSDAETWDSDTSAWDEGAVTKSSKRFLMASTTPQIYLNDTLQTFNGTAFTAYAEREGWSAGEPTRRKYLRAVKPIVDAVDGTVLRIRVGAAESPRSAVTWQPYTTFTVGTDQQAFVTASGRYLAFRVESQGNQSWRIRQMLFDLQPQGAW